MTLEQWALRHNVTHAALVDLRRLMGHDDDPALEPLQGDSEAAVQVGVRLAATRAGWRVFRNNNGAGKLADGSFVRWGLANDSAQLNAKLKSSDLIGLRPVLIEQAHVGSTIGQFVSLEVKARGWRYTGTDREIAQDAWLRLVVSLGGYGRFTTGALG